MAWTVKSDKEKRNDGSVVVSLTYTDGVRTVKDFLDVQSGLSDNDLAIKAKARIAWLDAQDAAFSAISSGDVTPKDPDPIITPPPTAQEVARAQFLTDYRSLQQAQKAVGLGLLDAQDKAYTDLAAKVKGEFLLEYLAFI